MKGMKASSSDLCFVRVLFRHWTWQDTLSQKLLDMAVKTWDGAQEDLDGAREDLDFARQGLRQAVQNGDEKERKEAKEEFDKAKEEFEKAKEEAKRAESKVQTAKEEATKAKEELEKAKSMAPLQAGGAQLLLFVRSTIFASWGHALLSARVPLFVKLFSLCWLAAQRERPVLRSLCALRVAVAFV